MNDDSRQKDMGAYVRQLVELDKSALPPDGGEQFNRLIFSGSPYLLQHAENPVDWFSWGEEAFAKARAEEKPVFLSIGYATCHWCHVMAHESFEDRDVAAVLNDNYVAIKVDREERPDIDDQYMTVSRLMTGSGGWPLNVFLTPDKRPFLAVTYLPKLGRGGGTGFVDLLENVAALWSSGRDRVEKNCADVMAALRQAVVSIPASTAGIDLPGAAFRQLDAMYDPEWGGLGAAPKFPMPGNLSFLLRFWHRSGNPRPRAMVEHTLRMMRQGGIWDQVGGGVHRYSVDREWLVPHFEKMLYDQALIATACIETFRATGAGYFMSLAEDIFAFVLRELTSPEGGFYSALDADTEGEEGKYYLWSQDELQHILGAYDGELFCRLFGVTAGGNFEGSNILHLPIDIGSFAEQEGLGEAELTESLTVWRQKLLAVREMRVRPLRDEKIITAWNGLMIAALADAYAAAGGSRYLAAAEQAAACVKRRLTNREGRLMRSCHEGGALVPGFLEDYAFMVRALLMLYRATFRQAHLDDALRLNGEMLRLFSDPETGGLYATGADVEEVLVKVLDAADNVIPSGAAVAAGNLAMLGRMTGDRALAEAGSAVATFFTGQAARQPAGYLQLLTVAEEFESPGIEIVLAGRRESPAIRRMLGVIGKRFLPNLVLTFRDDDSPVAEALVCTASACLQPVAGPEELGRLLDDMA
jgi:uncharacterized protein YyaL (SSP411 family)